MYEEFENAVMLHEGHNKGRDGSKKLFIHSRAWSHAIGRPKDENDELFREVERLSSRQNAERVMNDAFHNCPIEELFIKKGDDTYISMKPIERALEEELKALKEDKKNEQLSCT